jgi:peptide/nickel transport system ATP-binding protein
MYQGRIVERGPADDVILRPQHDYTKKLADAAPNPERRVLQSFNQRVEKAEQL